MRRRELSCVEPRLYAERFSAMVERVFGVAEPEPAVVSAVRPLARARGSVMRANGPASPGGTHSRSGSNPRGTPLPGDLKEEEEEDGRVPHRAFDVHTHVPLALEADADHRGGPDDDDDPESD